MKKYKHKKMRKKIRKKIEFGIAFGIVAVVTVTAIWSVRFGNDNPQTGLQHVTSLVERNKPKADTSNAIVFLGDSITAREDWNVLFGVSNIINAGISGNVTDDVIVRLDPVISVKPKKIFLMIGINDLLRGKDVSYVLANYGLILNKIKAETPDTLIYIQSVLPVNNDISQYGTVDAQKIIALNGKLKVLAAGEGSFFIDLYPHFCGADNKIYLKYASDGVHPNANGYASWKSLISQYVK
jgi:lysophospholipase L1-like esterase